VGPGVAWGTAGGKVAAIKVQKKVFRGEKKAVTSRNRLVKGKKPLRARITLSLGGSYFS